MKEEKTYFADTSFLIDLMNNREEAIEIFEKSDLIVTGTISLFELEKKHKVNTEEVKDSVERFNISDAEKSSELHRELEKEGDKINQIDYLIASQAINRNLTLLTIDKDFESIEQLETRFYREIDN